MHIHKQSPGRLFKISAERGHRGACWKEGALSRHFYYSETTNLYWFRRSSSSIVIDKVAKKQIFFLSNKVRDGGGGGVKGTGDTSLFEGGHLKRKETRLDPGKSIICQHKSNYLI